MLFYESIKRKEIEKELTYTKSSVKLSTMIKIKTSELSGTALDWAVAKAAHYLRGTNGMWSVVIPAVSETVHLPFPRNFSPSTRWSQCGPIIELEKIGVSPVGIRGNWAAGTSMYRLDTGPTPLIAAMRCFVASKLGEEVEIPEELVDVK